MIVAIPSKGRAGRSRAQAIFPAARIYVPELEASAYRARGARNVVEVPDRIRGITATRNFILDAAEAEGETRLLFVDDDPIDCGFWTLGTSSGQKERLTSAEWIREVGVLFGLMEELGLRAFGVHTQSAKRSVYPYHPFRFRSYLTASFLGLAVGRVRFDEAFEVKEDYELVLRLLEEDGAVLSVQYLFWENEHLRGPGGCSDYRTEELEEDAIQRLIEKYPGRIRRAARARNPFAIELDL